jgi:SAM-dependent methyltransferase
MSNNSRVNSIDSERRSQRADIETSSDEYASRFSGPVGEYLLKVQEEMTLSLLEPWQGSQVLDVGGGHGQLAVPLVREGFRVTVAGSDAACRARLDRVLPPGSFRFEVCDLLALPFEDRSFDVVLAFRLLPHEENWAAQISEMCRVARHAVIVDYPDIRSFNLLYKSLFALKKGFERNTREFITFRRGDVAGEFRAGGFAAITWKPQFFAPMVVHRYLQRVPLSRSIERISSMLGLTRLFGSPVIVRACRQ